MLIPGSEMKTKNSFSLVQVILAPHNLTPNLGETFWPPKLLGLQPCREGLVGLEYLSDGAGVWIKRVSTHKALRARPGTE